MAGEINFGILDPKLGASFATGYNEAENRRNELAAQVQQRALGEQQLQQAMSQNELSKYTLSSAKRSDAQREALDAYVNNPSFNPKDPAQLQKLMGFGEAGRGMLKAVMDRATSEATLAKTRGEVNAQDFKAAKDRHDALAGALGPLAAAIQAGKPVTHNDVFGAAQQLLGSNVISQKDLASIPMQAERLPQYIMGLVASNENSRKALEMYLPKAMVAGGTLINTNPMAAGGMGSPIANISPVPSTEAALMQARTAARNAATSEKQLGVSQGQLAATQAAQRQALDLANRPVFSEAGQGFISRPTAAQPAGAFTPLPGVKASQDQRAALKALKTAGYDPATGEDNISKLISESTSGGLQAASAGALGFLFGSSTSGMKAISALAGTANQIALDIVGGKLGAGISNDDRNFIASALGDVANPYKTAEERLAGWTAAKDRMVESGMIPPPNKSKPGAPTRENAAGAAGAAPTVDQLDDFNLRKP
jgi:hypothetical protein